MKKFITILSCVMTVFCVGGCGGNSKDPEETLKVIYDYSDKVMIDFGDSDNLWGLNGDCYNKDGVKKTCGRIMSEPTDMYDLIIMNNDKESLSATISGGDVPQLIYNNEDGIYAQTYIINSAYAYMNDGFCKYYLSGGDEDDEELCDASRKGDAEQLKENYKKMLSDIGITETDLKNFASWYAKNDGKKLLDKIEEAKASQKSLTPNEVKEALSTDFIITKVDNGVYMKDNLDTIMYIVTEKTNAIAYISELYDDITIYIYENGSRIASDDANCAYSLSEETLIKDSNCPADFVENAEAAEFSFNHSLESHKITIDELFNFFKNYK